MRVTKRFGENLRDIYTSGNFEKLHYDVVNRLRGEIPKLIFEIEILKPGD